MKINNNIRKYNEELLTSNCELLVVSKNQPISSIQEAYNGGHRLFGENKVQELLKKYTQLPKNIHWHMIGHLQRNKVKYIASFISLIHSVDSIKLLKEINKEAKKHNRTIDVLLQIHIAKEKTKFGLNKQEAISLIHDVELPNLSSVKIIGLMGMATNTSNKANVTSEFEFIKSLYEEINSLETPTNVDFRILSTGMSNDYKMAIKKGSTLIRIGSSIFKD